jgi:hypothetical protein
MTHGGLINLIVRTDAEQQNLLFTIFRTAEAEHDAKVVRDAARPTLT